MQKKAHVDIRLESIRNVLCWSISAVLWSSLIKEAITWDQIIVLISCRRKSGQQGVSRLTDFLSSRLYLLRTFYVIVLATQRNIRFMSPSRSRQPVRGDRQEYSVMCMYLCVCIISDVYVICFFIRMFRLFSI